MKSKVIWTSREWGLLARYFLDNNIDPDRFGFSGVLAHAQKAVLPPERHRSVTGVPAKLKQKLKEEIQGVEYVVALETPWPPESKLLDTKDLSTEDLLVELARRIARVVEVGKALMDSGLLASKPMFDVDRGFHPKHDPCCKGEERQRKNHTLILGPNGQQQERLRKAFPSLRLSCVTCEDNPAQCAVGRADLAIIWTKFCNHAQQEAVFAIGYTYRYANSLIDIENALRTYVALSD